MTFSRCMFVYHFAWCSTHLIASAEIKPCHFLVKLLRRTHRVIIFNTAFCTRCWFMHTAFHFTRCTYNFMYVHILDLYTRTICYFVLVFIVFRTCDAWRVVDMGKSFCFRDAAWWTYSSFRFAHAMLRHIRYTQTHMWWCMSAVNSINLHSTIDSPYFHHYPHTVRWQ